ncbi:MAG TPA: carboxypeptidase-like regulatory domain-containing protein, partial [Bacteroidota bacterium]|nr:carboxypeptidase-like regulatory domain-containing protein [Bacteroidota bacterium]
MDLKGPERKSSGGTMINASIVGSGSRRWVAVTALLGLCVIGSGALYGQRATLPEGHPVAVIRFAVFDSAEGVPISLARVVLVRHGKPIVQGATNPLGQIVFRDLLPGEYGVLAWFVGYESLRRDLLIDS